MMPGSLAACKAVWQAALAVLAPVVRVRRQYRAAASDYKQKFAACAGSVRSLMLECGHAGLTAARCLELASPQLHSLTIAFCDKWDWAGQLHRFPGLQRLAISCNLLDSKQAAALGHLPLRQLSLHFPNLHRGLDIDLPELPHVELLSITVGPDETRGAFPLPASGAWLGSGQLERVELRQMIMSPPPLVLSRLVALELGMVSLPVFCSVNHVCPIAQHRHCLAVPDGHASLTIAVQSRLVLRRYICPAEPLHSPGA